MLTQVVFFVVVLSECDHTVTCAVFCFLVSRVACAPVQTGYYFYLLLVPAIDTDISDKHTKSKTFQIQTITFFKWTSSVDSMSTVHPVLWLWVSVSAVIAVRSKSMCSGLFTKIRYGNNLYFNRTAVIAMLYSKQMIVIMLSPKRTLRTERCE